MKGRFGRVRLGAVWTILEPLAHLLGIGAIMYVRGMGNSQHEFFLWLLVGMSPFLLCKNIVLKLMGSVEANKALFSYKQIQPADSFIARAIVEFCIAAPVFIIIYASLTWLGFDTALRDPTGWLGILFTGIIFSFSLGIIFSVIADAIPESKIILRLIFLPLYLLSGVIFPINRIPRDYMEYIMWNPYLHMVDLLRSATFDNYRVYDGVSYSYLFTATVVVSFIGCALYRLRRFRLKAL